MNTYNFTDENFKKTESYQNFIKTNQSEGYLKIRAYTASQAIPIANLRVVVSKNIDNNKIIFFDGVTNSSGVIERIVLPSPKQNSNDLVTPSSITYDIAATYEPSNISNNYKINIYENIYVVQTINIVPTLNASVGEY